MIDHPQIVGVVMTNVLQAVGVLLATREQLFEIGKTGRHRLAPGIDDCRIRQDGLDQTDVHAVIR